MNAVIHAKFGAAASDLRDQRDIERQAEQAENAEFAREAYASQWKAQDSVAYVAMAIDQLKAQLGPHDLLILVQAVRAKLLESGNQLCEWVEASRDELGSVLRSCIDQIEEERIDDERNPR